jgi:hypothetical protein
VLIEEFVRRILDKTGCRGPLLAAIAEMSQWAPREMGATLLCPGLIRSKDKDSKGRPQNQPGRKLRNELLPNVHVSNSWDGQWDACHIWDREYRNNPECYSRVANLVHLPKAFNSMTEHFMPDVKAMLKYRCFDYYRWYPSPEKEPPPIPDLYPSDAVWQHTICRPKRKK